MAQTNTGTPPTSPNFAAPRYSANDQADYATCTNAVTDSFDLQAQKRPTIRAQSAAYTAVPGDLVLMTGGFTITLPTSPTAPTATVEVLAINNPVAVLAGGSDQVVVSGVSTSGVTVAPGLSARFVYGAPQTWYALMMVASGNVGDIKQTAAAVAPAGWLMCDGSSYARVGQYANLFAAIGTAYGGSGTTFNVPDLRGRVMVGAGPSYALASVGGEAAHTLANGEMPTHSHTGHTGTGSTGTGTTNASSTGGGTTGGGTTGAVNTGAMSGAATHYHNNSFGPYGAPVVTDLGEGWFMQDWYKNAQVGGAAHIAGAAMPAGSGNTASGYSSTDTQNLDHTHYVPGMSIPGLSVPALSIPGLAVPALSIPALTISNDGGGGPHNNLQPYIAINHVIRY